MNLFRLQNNTPPIYTDQSRDFQLFCRLYDCVNAGLKFDIDQITGILNAFTCRNNLLPLLQTKLGFFTDKHFEDKALRYVLDAFPDIVRKKGSLEGIQEALNVFLKIYGVRTEVVVWKYGDDNESGSFNIKADDYTIIIAINDSVKNTKILEEVFKYIFPVGFQFQFFFYNSTNQILEILYSENIQLIYVSNNIASMIRREKLLGTIGNESGNNTDLEKIIGGVDTTMLNSSSDSPVSTNTQ